MIAVLGPRLWREGIFLDFGYSLGAIHARSRTHEQTGRIDRVDSVVAGLTLASDLAFRW